MSHSLSRVYIHGILGTKQMQQLILPKIEREIYKLIIELFRENDSPALIVNGMPDHIHCLFRLGRSISVQDLFKNVKGVSSRMISNEIKTPVEFSWQTGYGAFSVSESRIKTVFNYIKNQKEYHRKKSLNKELDDLKIKLY